MTKTEMQAEALTNARSNQSVMNYGAIYSGFAAKGIAEAEIKPHENVFTFHAWKAPGRSVKKGEHGVRVVTFISCEGKEDPQTGEKTAGYRRPHTTTVFHISQTEPTSEREARHPGSSLRRWRHGAHGRSHSHGAGPTPGGGRALGVKISSRCQNSAACLIRLFV